jgi:hypothetical protein
MGGRAWLLARSVMTPSLADGAAGSLAGARSRRRFRVCPAVLDRFGPRRDRVRPERSARWQSYFPQATSPPPMSQLSGGTGQLWSAERDRTAGEGSCAADDARRAEILPADGLLILDSGDSRAPRWRRTHSPAEILRQARFLSGGTGHLRGPADRQTCPETRRFGSQDDPVAAPIPTRRSLVSHGAALCPVAQSRQAWREPATAAH